MGSQRRETVAFKGVSIIDSSRAFGHKSTLDVQASSYTQFLFATSSLSYDTAAWTTVAHVVIGFNGLLNDLEKKGILIKG